VTFSYEKEDRGLAHKVVGADGCLVQIRTNDRSPYSFGSDHYRGDNFREIHSPEKP
jgi:hypothetical protein